MKQEGRKGRGSGQDEGFHLLPDRWCQERSSALASLSTNLISFRGCKSNARSLCLGNTERKVRKKTKVFRKSSVLGSLLN